MVLIKLLAEGKQVNRRNFLFKLASLPLTALFANTLFKKNNDAVDIKKEEQPVNKELTSNMGYFTAPKGGYYTVSYSYSGVRKHSEMVYLPDGHTIDFTKLNISINRVGY